MQIDRRHVRLSQNNIVIKKPNFSQTDITQTFKNRKRHHATLKKKNTIKTSLHHRRLADLRSSGRRRGAKSEEPVRARGRHFRIWSLDARGGRPTSRHAPRRSRTAAATMADTAKRVKRQRQSRCPVIQPALLAVRRSPPA